MPPSLLRDVAATRKLLEFIYDTPNGGRSIARLARTCKAFNEPAVNVLWNELDSLLPLIGLFPSSIMKRPKRPELGLTKMPIDAEWKGLFPYADRVKKITYKEGADNVPTSIFPVFEGHSPREWILPKLTHLVWKCDTPAGLDHAKTFINRDLQSLTLEIGRNFSNLSDFLTVLSERTKLTAFSLSALGKLPDDFSRVMARQDLLEEVSIIASGASDARIGKWVSELPKLRSLRLDLTGQSVSGVEGFFGSIAQRSGWSTPTSEESRDSGVFTEFDSTEIKKTTVFSGSGYARQGAYHQLRELHLSGQVRNVVAFLKQLNGHIHTLELAIEDPPEEHDWQDLCAVICDKFSSSLRSLKIPTATPAKQMELPKSPGKPHDPISRRLPLSYFTSLPKLAKFEIDLHESVTFHNSDIAHFATICPAIEVLKLCPQAKWPSNVPPSVTLDGIAPLTSGCKRLHTLELVLTAKAGSYEILNTHTVSSRTLHRLNVGHSHLGDPIQVAILLSHLAPHLDNLKWLNERAPRSSNLHANPHTHTDGWHKVCEYLPHLQAVRLAEQRMSAVEAVAPPQMLEKSADATVQSADTGVQALVEVTECSVQSSPAMVDQEISVIPGVHEVSVDVRPSFTEAGVQVGPTLVDKSVGVTLLEKPVPPSTNAASKSPEAITESEAPKETLANHAEQASKETPVNHTGPAPKETPTNQTEPTIKETPVNHIEPAPKETSANHAESAPKETSANHTEPVPKASFPVRFKKASVHFFTFLLCSARPVDDEKIPAEGAS